uniref:ABC-transporter type IV n=1 Tax=Siphoviridae sp. ctxfQ4 TaxID=2826521 RepID=A0A8S5N5G9_9CAUD|nr:MAG TPA: Putative ABC-transporter type IV [Siphoviridae sp. ctxfQ4]
MAMWILRKHLVLAATGGLLYVILELVWRGRSHWTMFMLGGLCFVALGLINEVLPWDMPLWQQVLVGAAIVTVLEFVIGCVVNIWLGWLVWDYSGLPGNILGQICPQYCLLWLPVSLAGIVLDDWLRYWWWDEERPQYNI